MATEDAFNIGDTMLAYHQVITRGLSVSIEACRAAAQAGTGAGERRGLSDYGRTLASLIDLHHHTEDEIVFPYLEKLIPDAPYEQLRSDHQKLVPMLQAVQDACVLWVDGDDASLAAMSENLGKIDSIWHPHIRIEEEYYAPRALAELIAADEHARLIGELGQYSMQHIKEPPLLLPFVIYNADEHYRPIITRPLPAELTEQMIPVAWKEQWEPMKSFLLE